jgi:hypothetical protein
VKLRGSKRRYQVQLGNEENWRKRVLSMSTGTQCYRLFEEMLMLIEMILEKTV